MATNGNEQIYTDVILTIGGKNFAGLTSWDYQTAIDMIETTNMNTGDAAKTFKSGRYSSTLSIDGVHDPNKGATTMTDFWDLEGLAVAGTSSTLRIYEDDNSNGKYVEFTGLVNNCGFSGQDNSNINISCSFQASGHRTVGAVT